MYLSTSIFIMWTCLVVFIILGQSVLGDLVVQIQNGKVEGTTLYTPSGKTFYAWRGIPYGIAPLGKLRYLMSSKAEPWEGILDASVDGSGCVAFGSYSGDPVPSGSEDCLYINVYSPVPVGSNSSVEPTLPVMFWIYGGGFKIGSGDFSATDPAAFMEENVIVVTFNYRLGAFGFLSTEDEVITGNAGLKDQWLALIWTRENIAFFGGNPMDITIFGESAGAMSVGYHIVSPMSRNLFKGAIMESGSSLTSYIESNPKDFAYTLANLLDSSITEANTTAEIRDVLQAAEADVIVNLTLTIGKDVRPVIEVESNVSFLPNTLYEALESGDFAQIPIIIGYNSEETIGYIQDIETATNIASWYNSNPQLLVSNTHLKENVSAAAVGEEVRQMYVGQDGDFGKNLSAFLNWWSDDQFVRSSTKHAILQSKYSPVYLYQFSFYGTLSKGHPEVPGAGKVGHADEVGYLFNISGRSIATEEDYLTRRRFVKLWTNFAKTSNPTPDDDSAELLQNVKWEPITEDNVQFLDIDENLQMKPSRKVQETIFWDYIWENFSYRPYNTF